MDSGILAAQYSSLIQHSPEMAAHQEAGEAEEIAAVSVVLEAEVLVEAEQAEIIDFCQANIDQDYKGLFRIFPKQAFFLPFITHRNTYTTGMLF